MNTFRHYLLMLLFTAIPILGFSQTNGEIITRDGKTYKVISAADATLAYLGNTPAATGHLVIPETVLINSGVTYTVTETDYDALFRCYGITSVHLPSTIKKIGPNSFPGARLTSMNIPASLEEIHESAWASINGLPKFTVDASSTKFSADQAGALYSKDKKTLYGVPSNVALNNGVYTVDENVETIIKAVFLDVTGLTKIVFPKNLKEIKEGYPTIAPTSSITEFDITSGGTTDFKVIDGVLFKGTELVLYPRSKATTPYQVPAGIKSVARYAISNSSLMKAIDLNEVTKLADAAIYAAAELTSITLPKGIKPFDAATKEGLYEGCFEACQNIAEYKVPAENEYFSAKDGVIYSKDEQTLYFYPPSKTGDTYIIPGTVKTIGSRAFQGSKFIKRMNIPKNVETINPEAFREITELESVTYDPESQINKIAYYTFRGCTKLKEVTLPKKLIELDEVFYLCSNLETVNIPAGATLKTIKSQALKTNTKLKAFNFLGECALTEIQDNAFVGLKDLKTFSFPKSVTAIGTNAFGGCQSLETVSFDKDAEIVAIGSGAFADCGLKNFNVPKKVSKIEREAFRNCTALSEVNITETTTEISPEAFKYCTNLTDINVDKKNTVYSSVDGYLLSQNKKTLIIFPTGKANDQFTLLPPSITAIGEYAFYDCKKLKNVTIPNKVTSIGKRAFGLCDNLNTVTFLCDQMINPTNIAQGTNLMAFDDGTQQTQNAFGKIHINVRQDKLAQYQATEFYKKFASTSPSFTDGTEEYIAVSDKAVNLLSTTRTDYTFVLPTEVEHNGTKYAVSLIGDYAFQNAPNNIKEVVVKSNVKYIGAKAFVPTAGHIESVFFIESAPTKSMLSTTRFELDETGDNYNEFADNTRIYVKKSALTAYQTAWKKMVYDTATGTEKVSDFNFTSRIDYKIKDVKIDTKYGTFAREFDTDFSDYYATNNNTKIAAFVAGSKIENGPADYGTATMHIRMTSIDLNGGAADSYAYVPAKTGVLLKVLDSNAAATPADFYYTIGEKDNTPYNVTKNIMNGVTINPTNVAATASSPIYVMQKGTFQKVTTNISNFSVHKAYLKLNNPSGAKVMFHFDDDTTTGIEDITIDGENKGNDTFYNLNGQRVSNPQRGIYIHNGKKVIIK